MDMAFIDMWREIAIELGPMPGALARTKVNEALGLVYDENRWSFQLGTSGWLTPGLLGPQGTTGTSPGLITIAPYSNQVVGDPTAATAWQNLIGRPFISEMQFRIPEFELYDIIAFDGVNTLTLDRPWMEPNQLNQGYMIYQAYFPVPVQDFRSFIAIRDFTNTRNLDFSKTTRADMAVIDPQRIVFQQPTRAVPFDQDHRPNSATPGWMRYELWPHPLSQLPYSLAFMRRGPLLVNPSDMVPYPFTEEMIKWRGKSVSYLWKESQKGVDMQRGAGANWTFLSQAADKQYTKLLRQAQSNDRDLYNLYWTKLRRNGWGEVGPFFSSDGHNLTIGG